LSWLLKKCTICNLYGWRSRSLCRMCHTLLTDIPITSACLCEDSGHYAGCATHS
jgi:hypothetical protein